MPTSTEKDKPKKKGRPATGNHPMIGFRSPPDFTAQIDAYAAREGVPRSKAIRRMVDIALDGIPVLIETIAFLESRTDDPEALATASRLRDMLSRR